MSALPGNSSAGRLRKKVLTSKNIRARSHAVCKCNAINPCHLGERKIYIELVDNSKLGSTQQ